MGNLQEALLKQHQSLLGGTCATLPQFHTRAQKVQAGQEAPPASISQPVEVSTKRAPLIPAAGWKVAPLLCLLFLLNNVEEKNPQRKTHEGGGCFKHQRFHLRVLREGREERRSPPQARLHEFVKVPPG